jgi:GTP-binding protein
MFYDSVQIWVKGGDGGSGAISFRREKYVPRGGPDGGDGGNGGSVILVGDLRLDSLLDFNYKRRFSAEPGTNGTGKLRHGRNGKDLRIKVPLGTVVWLSEKDELVGEVIFPEQELIVALGGKGGRGNHHFATAVRQAPRKAESGTPGEEHELRLELKLIADVGLVGLPNAGKSSLLRQLTNATPEVGAFPFTTKRPFLGVMDLGDFRTATIADLPGMVEGAHHGKGLGLSFLRHAERCPILILVVDVARDDGSNPNDDVATVLNELGLHNPELPGRIKIVAANKMDKKSAENGLKILEVKNKGVIIIPISALTGYGLEDLKSQIILLLSGEKS